MAAPVIAAGSVRSYGPYASATPDSGTCGNNWANDTFNRLFFVDTNNPNTVTQVFANGKFVTVPGASPGGCDTNPGGTVGAGVTGGFGGYFIMKITGGTYNPNAVCTVATCSTSAGFVKTVYGPTATYNVPTFEFYYVTCKNGSWKNASADRGGNKGDITGNPKPCYSGDGE
jgi:hypothetical protein